MYYEATPKDIFRSLPPADQDELMDIIGWAVAEEAAEVTRDRVE